MLIRRHTFTILSFLFFMAMLYRGGLIAGIESDVQCGDSRPANVLVMSPCNQEVVSPETSPRVTVKQGATEGGEILVTLVDEAPQVAPAIKTQNHIRTLRAFLVTFPGREPVFYLESLKPHAFYAVTGNFVVAQDSDSPAWTDNNTLFFRAIRSSGELVSYQLNVTTLSLVREDSAPTPEVTESVHDVSE